MKKKSQKIAMGLLATTIITSQVLPTSMSLFPEQAKGTEVKAATGYLENMSFEDRGSYFAISADVKKAVPNSWFELYLISPSSGAPKNLVEVQVGKNDGKVTFYVQKTKELRANDVFSIVYTNSNGTIDTVNCLLEKEYQAYSNQLLACQNMVKALFTDGSKTAIKSTTKQIDIDIAKSLVNQLPGSVDKNNLLNDIANAQNLLSNPNSNAQTLENAKAAVDALFANTKKDTLKTTTDQVAIDNAQNLLSKVEDAMEKAELQKDIDQAQKLLDVNYEYRLKGLGDITFATLDISTQKLWADFDIKAIAPHVYFKDRYASIEIQDKYGQSKFYMTFNGTDTLKSDFQGRVKLAVGDEITTYHREATGGDVDRLQIQNEKTKASLKAATTITYVVTSQGLVAKTEILSPRETVNNLFENKDPKGAITSNLTQANIDAAQALVNTVTDMVEKAALQKDLNQAQKLLDVDYEYRMKGLGDITFATIDISTQKLWADIDLKPVAAHVYFADKYASILIQDKNGREKYSMTFNGKDIYGASQSRIKLAIGDEITTYHREATGGDVDRLQIQNEKTKAYLKAATTITYVVTSQGLVAKADI
ncbi:putative mucin/carbohydrate-binding domain-containing protein [Listeria booriae]|uniref:Uncharacterized protein n=1 Tax=Listeria booriae TaxID=1552123 RepID=A0A7X0XZE9_9LIST|nr:putative mucin/carbohydrate-binding domain-containing protein [Listeria booriae]MBC1794107.1 hypothetical protein [Listeria booriae]